MDLSFGVPKLRQEKNKTEKYPTIGTLTFLPTGEGLGRKMELNTYAIDALNLTDKNNQVSFSFSGEDIYIVNTSNSGVKGLKVGKTTHGFSDKKHYDYIKFKTFNIADDETLELFLEETDNEYNGNKVFKLSNSIKTQDSLSDEFTHVDNKVSESLEADENGYRSYMPEYNQEQLDEMESMEYAKTIEVHATCPDQMHDGESYLTENNQ